MEAGVERKTVASEQSQTSTVKVAGGPYLPMSSFRTLGLGIPCPCTCPPSILIHILLTHEPCSQPATNAGRSPRIEWVSFQCSPRPTLWGLCELEELYDLSASVFS